MVVNAVGMGSAKQISGIQNISINAGAEIDTVISADSIFPEATYLRTLKPGIQVSSTHISQVLDGIGLFGFCFDTDGSHPGVQNYATLRDCAGPVAGAAHRYYQTRKGIIWVESINVEHAGDATANIRVLPAYDGTNLPITITDSVSVPAKTAAPNTFTIHSVKVGNVVMTGVRSVNLSTGISEKSEGADSDFYDSFVEVSTATPTVTISGVDTKWLNTVTPLNGKTVTHANCEIILRRRDQFDIVTGVHIKFTFAGLLHPTTVFNGSNTGIADVGVTVACTFDGTNLPIKYETGYSYP